jgi:UDP-GlcNAc:undecaprenyl-phosphate GlcNAc-1-phosphate transferase
VLLGFLAGAAVISATGFMDDVYRIPPVAKFLGEILAAGTFVLVSGVSLEDFGDLFGFGEIRTGIFTVPLAIFCMVGVMNALNLSDGLDGLAGGISLIACAFLGIFAYLGQDWIPLAILVALVGSLFGFLRYNTFPANLFMGDTGSLLLGYTLSAVCLMLVRNDATPVHFAPVTVAAVLALPIMDTILVMARRLGKGENPFNPDKTHLHHRLLSLGLPHGAVVPVLYIGTALFGFQAWGLRSSPDWLQLAAVLVLGAILYGLVDLGRRVWMLGIAFPLMMRISREGGLYPFVARVMGKSVPVVGWVIGIGLFLPTVVLGSVSRTVSAVAVGVGLFMAALYPWRARRSRSALCYGLMYAGSVFLLAILQTVPGAPKWMPAYLAVFSAMIMGWVLLKMKYRGHREIVLVSSFEILMIGAALFVPVVLVPALGLGEGVRRLMLTVCFESIAFLMAMKILVRRRPSRNHAIAAGFLAALLVVAAKGIILAPVVTASAPPVFVESHSLPAVRPAASRSEHSH